MGPLVTQTCVTGVLLGETTKALWSQRPYAQMKKKQELDGRKLNSAQGNMNHPNLSKSRCGLGNVLPVTETGVEDETKRRGTVA